MNREELLRLQEEKRKAALAIIDKAKAEKRSMNDEERKQVETLTKEAEEAKAKAEKLLQDEEAERKLAGLAIEDKKDKQDEAAQRSGVEFPPADKQKAYRKDEMGKFFMDVMEYCQSHGATKSERMLYWHNRAIAEARANGFNISTPADGGFFLPPLFIQTILGGIYEGKDLINLLDRYPSNGTDLEIPCWDETSRVKGNHFGGIVSYRKKEAASMTATKGQIGLLKVPDEELTVLVPLTNKLMKNAPALLAFINKGVDSVINWDLTYELLNGTGAGELLGLYNAPALIEASAEAGQDADTVIYKNLLKMEARLPSASQARAVYVANPLLIEYFEQLTLAVGTGGAVMEKFRINQFGPGIHGLMNRPCFLKEQCKAVGDKGDIYLFDPKEFILSVNDDVTQDTSIHVYYLTNETAFRIVMSVNGQPTWKAARTTADSATTISPYVTLAARA